VCSEIGNGTGHLTRCYKCLCYATEYMDWGYSLDKAWAAPAGWQEGAAAAGALLWRLLMSD